jgi:adenosylhomocysteine nucleosidase
VAKQPTIALIAAMHDEIAPTIKRLGLAGSRHHATGTVAGQEVVAAAIGIGRQRIEAQLTLLLEQYPIRKVIHLGVSGALQPGLTSGQLLRIDRVMCRQGEPILINDVPSPTSLVTVDSPVCTTESKRLLFEEFAAQAVDMETYYVAVMLRARAVELISLRAISDPADVALPPQAINWVRDDGSTCGLAAAGYLLGHPWQLGALLQLRCGMKLGVEHLAGEVQALLDGAMHGSASRG